MVEGAGSSRWEVSIKQNRRSSSCLALKIRLVRCFFIVSFLEILRLPQELQLGTPHIELVFPARTHRTGCWGLQPCAVMLKSSFLFLHRHEELDVHAKHLLFNQSLKNPDADVLVLSLSFVRIWLLGKTYAGDLRKRRVGCFRNRPISHLC